MLPTEKATNIYQDRKNNLWYWASPTLETSIAQHLYITSDEEIKNGDIVYEKLIPKIISSRKIRRFSTLSDNSHGCKKVITSTDESLGLARPSDSFIKAYIKAYNEGKPITEVMVQYESINVNHDTDFAIRYITQPKVAPDNTITIRSAKDSWTREEVIELCKKAFNNGWENGQKSMKYKNSSIYDYQQIGKILKI